jgi:predicted nucleotidyltransferase
MPVRSLTSPVLKWPDAPTVVQALKKWAEKLVKSRPDVLRIGYFGSYARGDWGVGSDLDLLMVVEQSETPFEMRAAQWDTLALPVPADVLTYTWEEWQRLKKTRKFFRVLAQEVVWIYQRTAKDSP